MRRSVVRETLPARLRRLGGTNNTLCRVPVGRSLSITGWFLRIPTLGRHLIQSVDSAYRGGWNRIIIPRAQPGVRAVTDIEVQEALTSRDALRRAV